VEGEGSRFTLILPGAPPKARVEPAPIAALPAPSPRLERRAESLSLPEPLTDDRADLAPSDRVAVVMTQDRDLARGAVEVAHEHGFKCLLALRGDAGLALVHEFIPKAVVVSSELPQVEGRAVLDHLKRHPETRHIPVFVMADEELHLEVRASGALGVIAKPVTREALAGAFDELAGFLDKRAASVLLVEDDELECQTLAQLVGGADVEVVTARSREEALERLDAQPYDCVVVDMSVADGGGFAVLERIKRAKRFRGLPVIAHARTELGTRERTRLRRFAQAMVLKDAPSPERLLEEATLYLHSAEARLPIEKREMLKGLHAGDAVFEGKKVLIVDDDVRNVFALASVFERRGMQVVFAENGREGVEALREHPDVALVLMDIMMPEMDGYEATRTVREMPEFERLPILALTAKAMRGDREKSLASGASDYITKPVDVDQLLSLMRVWLHR